MDEVDLMMAPSEPNSAPRKTARLLLLLTVALQCSDGRAISAVTHGAKSSPSCRVNFARTSSRTRCHVFVRLQKFASSASSSGRNGTCVGLPALQHGGVPRNGTCPIQNLGAQARGAMSLVRLRVCGPYGKRPSEYSLCDTG